MEEKEKVMEREGGKNWREIAGQQVEQATRKEANAETLVERGTGPRPGGCSTKASSTRVPRRINLKTAFSL